jgi:hypothetical protein
MELIKSGDYKRPVMENDEVGLTPDKINEAFDSVIAVYEERTSNPDNYEYFSRRQEKSANLPTFVLKNRT